jgi:hypothetical protein
MGGNSNFPSHNNGCPAGTVCSPDSLITKPIYFNPICSNASHIANPRYQTYLMPSVTHTGINSTLIPTDADHHLGSW